MRKKTYIPFLPKQNKLDDLRDAFLARVLLGSNKELFLITLKQGFVLNAFGPSFPNCFEIDHTKKTLTFERHVPEPAIRQIQAYLKIEDYRAEINQYEDLDLIVLTSIPDPEPENADKHLLKRFFK